MPVSEAHGTLWEDRSAVSVGKKPGHSSADFLARGLPVHMSARLCCHWRRNQGGALSTFTEALGSIHFLAGVFLRLASCWLSSQGPLSAPGHPPAHFFMAAGDVLLSARIKSYLTQHHQGSDSYNLCHRSRLHSRGGRLQGWLSLTTMS